MRFMIIVRSMPAFEAATQPVADEALFAAMVAYHEEQARAGALLDASGLRPSRDGWRIRYGAGGHRVIDGPLAEAKELITGYTLISVRSRDEALEWSKRLPNPSGIGGETEIEVRQLSEFEDFTPSPPLDRFRAMALPSQTA